MRNYCRNGLLQTLYLSLETFPISVESAHSPKINWETTRGVSFGSNPVPKIKQGRRVSLCVIKKNLHFERKASSRRASKQAGEENYRRPTACIRREMGETGGLPRNMSHLEGISHTFCDKTSPSKPASSVPFSNGNTDFSSDGHRHTVLDGSDHLSYLRICRDSCLPCSWSRKKSVLLTSDFRLKGTKILFITKEIQTSKLYKDTFKKGTI